MGAPVDTLPGNDTFLTDARRRWKIANEAETANRKEGLEDLNFLNLDQWPANVKELRNETGRERPCLTIDQIGQPYRQLVSNQQQADAAIRIVPEQGPVNEDSAKLTQGLIRAIEYQSDAKTAYGMAFASGVANGWGYIRVRSDYESADTFDQKIIIEGIENPFSVYIDPAARQPQREDMQFALITQDMPWEDYKREFPQSELSKYNEVPKAANGLVQFAGVGDAEVDWFPEGRIRIAEYYYLHYDKQVRHEGADGKAYPEGQMPEGVAPTGKVRTVQVPSVRWCKINGVEVLDGVRNQKTGAVDQKAGRTIPGTSIPIRPCYGEALNVNGRRVYRGIVRAARDPQRMYNYQNSSLVEDLALNPKTPIIGVEGQFEGHEEKWDQINVRAFSYAEYRPVSLGGNFAPPPGRPPGPDAAKIQATVMAINQAKSDLRSTTGWYDATDPNRRNADQSGRAIQARKQSQDESGVPYFENFRKMLISTGKLLLEWLPVIYDRPGRIVQVLGGEDEPEWAMLKTPFVRNPDGQPMPVNPMLAGAEATKNVLTLDPSQGIYGVRVTIGSSYTTRKQEAADMIGGVLGNAPGLIGVIGDLYFKNLDIPDAEAIAERVKRTIPPHILGEEGMEDVPPQAQAKMAQMEQALQQMQQQLGEAQKALETKQIEAQAKAQIADRELQGKMAIEELKAENERQIAEMQNEIAVMNNQVKLAIAQMQIEAKAQSEQLAVKGDALRGFGDMAAEAARSVAPSDTGSRP